MDRNFIAQNQRHKKKPSLSARRAWIETKLLQGHFLFHKVALRKESVDRNVYMSVTEYGFKWVALRKESVDRNMNSDYYGRLCYVALRKESVDRNCTAVDDTTVNSQVALRKESVDRNVC